MYKILDKLDSIDRKLNTVVTYRGQNQNIDAPMVNIPKIPTILGLPEPMYGNYRLTEDFALRLASSAANITLYRFNNDVTNPFFTVVQEEM